MWGWLFAAVSDKHAWHSSFPPTPPFLHFFSLFLPLFSLFSVSPPLSILISSSFLGFMGSDWSLLHQVLYSLFQIFFPEFLAFFWGNLIWGKWIIFSWVFGGTRRRGFIETDSSGNLGIFFFFLIFLAITFKKYTCFFFSVWWLS